jgi:cytochrome c
MDSFEVNKILGAILFTCLVLLALNIAAGALFTPEPPKKPGYEIAVQEEPGAATAAAPAAEQPIEQALASADPKRGQQATKACQTCHTFEKGGPNKIGPNLWGVVGRKKGTEGGFAYSDAIKSKGGEWAVDDLNKFLANPRGYAPGTRMSFAGLQRENQRADVIAYLNSLSDNPKPLPTAAPSGGEKAQQPKAGGETTSKQGQATPGDKPNRPSSEAQTQVPAPAQPQVTSPGQSQAPQPGSSPEPKPGQKSE